MVKYFTDKEKKYLKEKYGIEVPDNFKPLTLSQRMYVEGRLFGKKFNSKKELDDFTNKVIEEMNIKK